MKIPLFSKLTAKSRGRKVVRASARAMRGGEEDYYEAEPNMKLSHAFMVVLILHIVAVGGIYAFNQIKVNRRPDLSASIASKSAQATADKALLQAVQASAAPVEAKPQRQPGDADDPLPVVASVPATPVAAPAVVTTTTKPAPAPAGPAVTQTSPPKAEVKPAAARTTLTTAPAAPAKPKASAPGTYKVAKGDNPYTIAKKFGVSSQELLKVNGITDPTKLQIGQVLKVPGKSL